MQASTFLSSDYLDIIYQNRNKLYGGYQLRRQYSKRALIALLMVAAGFSLPFLMLPEQQLTQPVQLSVDIPTTLTHILPETPIYHPPAPKPASTAVTEHPAGPPLLVDDHEVSEVESSAGNQEVTNETGAGEAGSASATEKGDGNATVTTDNVADTPTPPLRYATEMPAFIGNLNEYLSRQLHYPALAKENNIEGKVSVEFVVDENGAISDARILRGIGGGCEEEALRVIRSMPKWKPGKQHNKAVKVVFVLPIVFVLD